MRVFRLTRREFAEDLSGSKAARCGGRWHPKGLSVLYTSESRALLALELVARMNPLERMDDLVLVSLSISAGRGQKMIEDVNQASLPEGWRRNPLDLSCQQIGRSFLLENQALGLRVPSSLIGSEHHILLNPAYDDFHKRVRVEAVEPFSFQHLALNSSIK